MSIDTISSWRSHGGVQSVHTHASSSCKCDMTFSVFLPPQAEAGKCPVLYYLSGLTCTHANATEKGEFREAAARHGIIIVCPDTSPRGVDVPDEGDGRTFAEMDETEKHAVSHRGRAFRNLLEALARRS